MKADWDKAAPAELMLVSGKEDYLADQAIARIKGQLLGAEVKEIDAKTYSCGELSLAASPSLFSEPRLIIARNVEECNDDFLQEALDYVAAPPPEVYALFHHRSGVRGKKLLTELRKQAVEIVCAEIGRNRPGFVTDLFKVQKRRISAAASRLLADCFEDTAELAAATNQLMGDVPDELIEVEDVERYYWDRSEISAMRIVDTAVSGQQHEAVKLLQQFITAGGSPVPVVAMLAAKLRLIAKVKYGSPPGAPWQIETARRQARLWSDEDLALCLAALAKTDADVKGFSRTPEFSLEKTVRQIAACAT